jgi:tetratricopeptide (TPR) repeat protein/tRNA A-37 threonylcarbamoyl transferase component Bud32
VSGYDKSRMTRARWLEMAPLVDTALDLDPAERERYFDELAASDPLLATELRQLFAAVDGDEVVFDAAARGRAAMLAPHADASALRDELQHAFGGEYAIERELGGAGMSRVFLADEPRLGRKVVIKIVRPESLAHVSAERFSREIRLAASLQQANIVPVLAAGTAAGFPYYTMPFVDGQSLRERLAAEGALPIREALSVLRDVLRALAHAHARGVVHRDIKPGNVLLSGGTAVVTDFGIARALGAAAEARDGDTLTQPGAAIGTPAYMAPEQATGDPSADHRADIYAFGCLAYAAFTARPPFDLDAPHRIIAAHFNTAPDRLTIHRADVPPAVAKLVTRCLEKDPDRRPQTAMEVLHALDAEFIQLGSNRVGRTWRRPIAAAALGFVLLSIVAAYASPHIAGLLRRNTVRASTGQTRQPVTLGTTNPVARDLYLVGRELLKRRGSGIDQGVAKFEHAIALDEKFAPAYAALATALELYPYFVGTPPSEVRERALDAARRALAVDSTLAEAHTALAWVHAHDGEWEAATAEFRRAVALSPRDATARSNYGRFLINRGEANEAFAQLEQALAADPASSLNSAWLSYAFLLRGNPDSALAESARAVQLDSTLLPTRNLGALVNLSLGRDSVARRLMVAAVRVGEMSNAAYVDARVGDPTAAQRLVDAMDAAQRRPWFRHVARATIALAARDTAGALGALERSSRETGAMWTLYLPVRDIAYDPVRATSRFAALARQAGLDVNGIAIH